MKTNSYHPEYQPFADALRRAMAKANINQSEVARRMWGTTKDKRGYEVARSRDRIHHYLAGTSYPEADNLVKLADAIGVPVKELQIKKPKTRSQPKPRQGEGMDDVLEVGSIDDGSGKLKLRLRIDRVLDWQLAIKIVEMIGGAEVHAADRPQHVSKTLRERIDG